MTKRELVWLIIRLVGVYFGYLTIVSLFSVIWLLPALIFTPPDIKTTQKPGAEMPVQGAPTGINEALPNSNRQTGNAAVNTEETASENVKNFLWNLLSSFIYGAVGFYLLRDGRLFFVLLMREDLPETKESEPEVTTLNL
jgi:hypothetical protein